MAGRPSKRRFTAEGQISGNPPSAVGAVSGNGADTMAAQRHDEVMEAIGALKTGLADVESSSGIAPEDYKREIEESLSLKRELKDLSHAIAETKREIANLRHPDADDDRLAGMTNQLDAVVMATEQATDAILAAAEKIDENVGSLRARATEDNELSLVDDIGDQVIGIYEACNFQDLTGQRITKVVTTLTYIENRVDRMMEIMGGPDAFVDVPLPEAAEPDADKALLQGPQLKGEGISQDDIDALFD